MNKDEKTGIRKRCEKATMNTVRISNQERLDTLIHIATIDIPQLLRAIEALEWNMQFMGYACKRCGKFTQEGHYITTTKGVDVFCDTCWDKHTQTKGATCIEERDLEKLWGILESRTLSPKGKAARKKFRDWLDGASKISAEDFNLVLKAAGGVRKGG